MTDTVLQKGDPIRFGQLTGKVATLCGSMVWFHAENGGYFSAPIDKVERI